MNNLSKLLALASVIAGLSTGSLAQQPSGNSPMMEMPAMQKMMQEMMPKEGDSASTKAFKEAHMKMMHNTPLQFTGNADVDLFRQMIPHHQSAIDMAKVQLAHGKDPKVRKMAQKIIKDQEKEIAQMEAWLKKDAK